jgi:hypothetical protein
MAVIDRPGAAPAEVELDNSCLDGPQDPDTPQEITPAEDSGERSQSDLPEETRTRGEVHADLRQQAESGWKAQKFDAPRAELAAFDLKRAGLPSMSFEEADRYIDQHREARPWLSMTDKASPEARRIIAALDAAGGHAHIRHEGWVTEEANMRRAAYREDPAQLDPDKRQLSVDGLRQNGSLHRCADMATRITDPDAFATAFVRGVEHSRVREALNMPYDPKKTPDEVALPIADLLGPDGHDYCTGWQLEPVDGSTDTALANRGSWVRAKSAEREPEVPEPRSRPVPTFEGGVVTFLFRRFEAEERYEVTTMFSRPPDQN